MSSLTAMDLFHNNDNVVTIKSKTAKINQESKKAVKEIQELNRYNDELDNMYTYLNDGNDKIILYSDKLNKLQDEPLYNERDNFARDVFDITRAAISPKTIAGKAAATAAKGTANLVKNSVGMANVLLKDNLAKSVDKSKNRERERLLEEYRKLLIDFVNQSKGSGLSLDDVEDFLNNDCDFEKYHNKTYAAEIISNPVKFISNTIKDTGNKILEAKDNIADKIVDKLRVTLKDKLGMVFVEDLESSQIDTNSNNTLNIINGLNNIKTILKRTDVFKHTEENNSFDNSFNDFVTLSNNLSIFENLVIDSTNSYYVTDLFNKHFSILVTYALLSEAAVIDISPEDTINLINKSIELVNKYIKGFKLYFDYNVWDDTYISGLLSDPASFIVTTIKSYLFNLDALIITETYRELQLVYMDNYNQSDNSNNKPVIEDIKQLISYIKAKTSNNN